MIIVINIFFI